MISDMRRFPTTLVAILYGSYQHLVRGDGLQTGDLAAVHARYGTLAEVETVCYTYVTTILVTAEPEKSVTSMSDECPYHV